MDNFTLALVNLDQSHFNMPSFIILIAAVWWFAPAQPVEYGYCMSGKCKHINLVAAILPPASVPATSNKAVSNHVAAEETLRSQGINIKIARQKYFVLSKNISYTHLRTVNNTNVNVLMTCI